MTTLTVPKSMARFVGNRTAVAVEARTLHGALRELTERHSLGDALLAPDGSLQPYLRVVVDERLLAESAPTELERIALDGARSVELKTAFAGG